MNVINDSANKKTHSTGIKEADNTEIINAIALDLLILLLLSSGNTFFNGIPIIQNKIRP